MHEYYSIYYIQAILAQVILLKNLHQASSFVCCDWSFISVSMENKYDLGTPIGGERKAWRLHSPLEEMDDMVPSTPPVAFAQVPVLPKGASSSNAITLEAMGSLLDSKLTPLVKSMESLKSEMYEMKGNNDTKFVNMQLQIDDFQQQTQNKFADVDTHIRNLQQQLSKQAVTGDANIDEKITEITREIQQLRATGDNDENGYDKKIVMGGLREMPGEEQAINFINKTLWENWSSILTGSHAIGDSGIMIFKFECQQDRNKALGILNRIEKSGSVPGFWAKADQPLHSRVVSSFLFGLRWLLGQWGYRKKRYLIDEENMVFEVQGEGPVSQGVLKVTVKEARLQLDWLDPAWQQWEALTDSEGFKSLIAKAANRLKRDGEGKGKSKGKGKPGSEE